MQLLIVCYCGPMVDEPMGLVPLALNPQHHVTLGVIVPIEHNIFHISEFGRVSTLMHGVWDQFPNTMNPKNVLLIPLCLSPCSWASWILGCWESLLDSKFQIMRLKSRDGVHSHISFTKYQFIPSKMSNSPAPCHPHMLPHNLFSMFVPLWQPHYYHLSSS